jgi:hypothetical protein
MVLVVQKSFILQEPGAYASGKLLTNCHILGFKVTDCVKHTSLLHNGISNTKKF